MRLGNNECPTCRKHCASRRSLRDDPNFDALIAALFKNIDKFEEEVKHQLFFFLFDSFREGLLNRDY
jgi:hypothetical protein